MNLADVMAEIAEVLAGIPGLNVHDHKARRVSPPAALVPLPVITYDETYGRGMDRQDFDLVIVVGAWDAESSTRAVGEYADGGGASSVKANFVAHQWTSCSDVDIESCEFATVQVGSSEFLGAVFRAVAVGSGS